MTNSFMLAFGSNCAKKLLVEDEVYLVLFSWKVCSSSSEFNYHNDDSMLRKNQNEEVRKQDVDC